MIIQLLLDCIYALFYALTAVIDIGLTPVEAYSVIFDVKMVLASGISVLSNYVDLSYLFVLFGIVLAVDSGLFIYHFVMWIIKKIPMLGVE